MAAIYGPLATQIASLVSSGVIDNYCAVASVALVLYDHICTIPQEMQLIWGSKVTSTMVLFHANRWLILAYTILNIVDMFLHPGTIVVSALILPELAPIDAGRPRVYISYALDLCLFALWAAFSGIRVYALSGGSRLLSLAVALLSLVPVVRSILQNQFPAGHFPGACGTMPGYSGHIRDNRNEMYVPVVMRFRADMFAVEISTRVPVIIADIVVLVLTWCKTWATVRMAREHNVKTPLMNLLLRDGTLYFTCLLSLNLLNIVGKMTNVFTFAVAFSTPLSSIIITHFLLNLRQLAHGSPDDASCPSFVRDGTPDPIHSQTSSLRFGSFVGNMGESLMDGSEDDDRDVAWDDDVQDNVDNARLDAQIIHDLPDASAAPVGDPLPEEVMEGETRLDRAADVGHLV
ncbi:hypothetical protein CERSUDRAFT_77971 [Gelatoporia subvermispora B]|uniref:DUF6533 domain-containing protein n=1 Tax=Ceriporiopsis subvermispora (strain B) TaxID=914234 RepID=M2R0B6_CERS8|nr:hypothetical protein CERSUDRAFT_77971 [Gelatoporia subvermispora B]